MFQYAFYCNEVEAVRRIGTVVHVDDGEVHIVNIRCVLFCSFRDTVCCGQFICEKKHVKKSE